VQPSSPSVFSPFRMRDAAAEDTGKPRWVGERRPPRLLDACRQVVREDQSEKVDCSEQPEAHCWPVHLVCQAASQACMSRLPKFTNREKEMDKWVGVREEALERPGGGGGGGRRRREEESGRRET
jgi:hypothetical protein